MAQSADPPAINAKLRDYRHTTDVASLGNPTRTSRPVFRDGTKNTATKVQSLFAFTSKNHITPLLFAVVFALTAGAIPTAQAIILGLIFDSFTAFGAGSLDNDALRISIEKYCSYLAGLGGAAWLLNGGFFTAWLVFGELQAQSCRSLLFDGLLGKSCTWFDMRKLGAGALVARLHTQTRDLQIAVSQPLGVVLKCTVTATASLVVAFYYCWSLTLVILATLPILAFFLAWISADIPSSIEKQNEALANASKWAGNALVAIETVKAFNGQEHEVRKYSNAIAQAAKWYAVQANRNALQIGLVKFMTLCMFVQGFWYGHHLVESGSKSTGDVVTTFWSALSASQALEQIFPQLLVLEKGRSASGVLRATINDGQASSEEASESQGFVPNTIFGEIELRNVSFSYPARKNRLALNKMSCRMPSGRTTFITGPSGCGKSTLSQLLLRFYDVTSGDMLFDGHPIKSLNKSWLRRHITLVEQDSILFDGTLLYNIGLGRPDVATVPLHDVRCAVSFAALQPTVNSLPHGLETQVGAQGNSLSGGQRQRIALARARIRDSPILILDESTSALDQANKMFVMTAIRSWRKGKTTIIISHDSSQIVDEDFTLAMEHGCIKRTGNRYGPHFTTELSLQSTAVPVLPIKENGSWSSSSRSNDGTPSTSYGSEKAGGTYAGTDPDALEFHFIERPQPRYVPTVFTGHMSPMTMGFWTSSILPLSSLERDQEYDLQMLRETLGSPSSESLQEDYHQDGTFELLKMSGQAALRNRELLVMRHRQRPHADHKPVDRHASTSGGTASGPAKSLVIAPVPSIRSILATAWPTLDAKCRVLLVLGILSSVLHAIATPMFAWVFSKLLSSFYQTVNASTEALQSSLAILGIAAVDGCACFFMHNLLEYCGQKWVDHIRVNAVRRLLDQPRQFLGETAISLSQITADLDRSAEEMRNLLGRFAAFLLVGLILMGIALLWSLATCWKLTVVGISIAPASYAITRSFQAVSAKMEAQCTDAANDVATVVDEVFTNIKTIRALALERRFGLRHDEAVSCTLSKGLRRAAYCGMFFGLSEALVILMTALIFWYGAVLASTGAASINNVLLVFSMLLFSLANLTAIITFVPQIQSSKDTAMRLMNLAELPRTSHEHLGTTKLTQMGEICLNDLTFSYYSSPDDAVLRNVELKFHPGKSTAIVGPSGSGKSTILSLLLRMYPAPIAEFGKPPALAIAGRDINSIETSSLRELVGFVSQRGFLFAASISENIRYGLPTTSHRYSHESVRAAACNAGIDDFIMSLPLGYDTLVGDGGSGLSGGQVQRICLARALVRQPKVLLLDEATSALDAENAALIRKALQRLMRQQPSLTIIMVTHDREMTKIADRIIVLDRGKVAGPGNLRG